MKLKRTLIGTLCAATALTLTGCNPKAAQDTSKTAKLAYCNWAEGVAYTHLAKVVLEEKMGYEVELTAADLAPAYISVAQGSQDAFMECWVGMHVDYLARYKDDLVRLGVVYEGAVLGLAVPAYLPIDRIAELQEHAAKFDGKIVGIDAGAMMMRRIEDEIIPTYGLKDIELISSSGPAMTAALGAAIKNKEWIVVPAWKPHWMFGRWDLKFLQEDPDKPMWEPDNIEIVGRAHLKADKPELAQFLSNMYLTDPQLSDLILKIKESDLDTLEAARQWMHDNEAVVSAWIPHK
jgi:glycine betaine/proline transport system substrate-binding protein